MPEHKCPNCHAPLDFQTLLLSTNPAALDCKGCDEKIRVGIPGVSLILIVVAAGCYFLYRLLTELGLGINLILIAIIAFLLAAEYVYYEVLRRGILPSNLIDTNPSVLVSSKKGAGPKTANSTRAPASRIIPRIKHRGYLDSVRQAIGDVPDQLPFTQPLFGDLILAYAIDTNEGHIALSPSTAKQFGFPIQEPDANLKNQAEANALPSLSNIHQLEDGLIKKLTCDQHMMACGVLFPALWDQIERDAGTEVVIAVLHRDHIWFAPSNDASAVESLKTAVADTTFNDSHELSKTLYVREEDEWVEFTE